MRLRTENVNMFSVLEENKSLRLQLGKPTEKVSHDVLVEVKSTNACCDLLPVCTRLVLGQPQTAQGHSSIKAALR